MKSLILALVIAGVAVTARADERTVVIPTDTKPFTVELGDVVRVTGHAISGGTVKATVTGPAKVDAEIPSKLDGTWNAKFARSVDSLIKANRVHETARKLRSLDEFVEHYPNKTHDTHLRTLRQQLLPQMKEQIEQRKGPLYHLVKYNTADNEEYLLNSIKGKRRQRMKNLCKALDKRLLKDLRRVRYEDHLPLFNLMAKGKSLLFVNPEYNQSFTELLEECAKKNLLSDNTLAVANALHSAFFPKHIRQEMALRSQIHSLVSLASKGNKNTLHTSTLDYLEEHASEVVTKLPGYKPLSKGDSRFRMVVSTANAHHDAIMHKLIDQQVFSDFRFIRLPKNISKE